MDGADVVQMSHNAETGNTVQKKAEGRKNMKQPHNTFTTVRSSVHTTTRGDTESIALSPPPLSHYIMEHSQKDSIMGVVNDG